MKRVMLVSPTWYSDPEMREVYFPMPPISLGYLAACLEKEGHVVEIFDVLGRNNEIADRIKQFKPDVVGVQCYSTGFISFLDTVAEIRKCFDGLLVAGGPHVTAVNELPNDIAVDYWMKGPGERTLVKIVNGWRPENNIIFGEEIEDLDSLPFPSWHLMELDRYKVHLENHGMSVISSRGCPYRCIFCFDAHQRRLIFRKPESVVEEMMILKEKYGFRKFFFMDDTFVFNAKRIKQFADLLEGAGISFACNGRCNLMTDEMMKDLKRAGCFLVYYGVESGVQRVLDVMKKNITLEQVINSLELAKKYGIRVATFLLISNPTETKEEMQQTMDFGRMLYKKYKCTLDMSVLYCYPNTPVYKMAGLEISDWSQRRHSWRYPTVPIYVEKQYTLNEILALYKKFLFEIDLMQTPKHKLPIAGIRYIGRTIGKKIKSRFPAFNSGK